MMAQSFGITRDTNNVTRHSLIYVFRGGASNTVDVYDLAAGTWDNAINYGNKAQTFTTGSSAAYDPVTLGGKYMYININGTHRMGRFDMRNRLLDTNTYLRFAQGAATVGGKVGTAFFIDGSTKLSFVYTLTHTQSNMFCMAVIR
jgi:hypothetical protein